MKVPNFLCCSALAFVNEKMNGMSSSGRVRIKRRGSHHLASSSRLLQGQDVSQSIPSSSWDDDVDGEQRNYHSHDATNGGVGNRNHLPRDHRPTRRRTMLGKLTDDALALASSSLALALLATTDARPAVAACLGGDIRPDCIGVYKLPIDAAEMPYVDTPEKLRLYAPDLRWVPPTPYPPTYADALRQLTDQRSKLDDARDLVAGGGIEGAGLALLEMIPKVGVAGAVIVRTFDDAANGERNMAMKIISNNDNMTATKSIILGNNSNDGNNPSSTPNAIALEMKAYRIKYALDELLGSLGETDILIGQGLRGELGVSAVAQIQILNNLSDCRKGYDDLLGAVPRDLALVHDERTSIGDGR